MQKLILINIFFVSILSSAQMLPVQPKAPPPQTHTIVATVDMKTFNGKSCELVVAESLAKDHLKIIRVDPATGTYNSTYLVNHPEMFSRYGMKVDIYGKNSSSQKVKYILPHWEIGERNEIVLKVRFEDGNQFEKRMSLDQAFFKDTAKYCLK